MFYKLAFVSFALLVTGCNHQSPELIAARQAAIAEQDDAKCKSYGLKFGSPEYAQCRQNSEMLRARADEALSAQQAAFARQMLSTPQNQPQPYIMQPNPVINTSCTTMGAYTNCQTH